MQCSHDLTVQSWSDIAWKDRKSSVRSLLFSFGKNEYSMPFSLLICKSASGHFFSLQEE